ncbi:hypothetical protein [Prauserella endophytica]|uniref:hypothetical protein n=1 Tax=Prauserella endophytica TaxID=1592324 RepID=UPI00130507F0|nr:hypothetical protein [Prauserella endophytica]
MGLGDRALGRRLDPVTLNIEVSAKVLGVLMCREVVIVMLWELAVLPTGGSDSRGFD